MAAERYDGLDASALATRFGVPHVELVDSVPSTMDLAHQLAEGGAVAGTLVLAERQSAGRGRGGKVWISDPGRGIWMTLIERPSSPSGLDVLSLRLGLAAAPVLNAFTQGRVLLKWPNDLYVGAAKLAGILVEARWRASKLEWVAIGMGVNVSPPSELATATGLRAGVARAAVLDLLVPALRRAAAANGALTSAELTAYATRDLAAGHRCVGPAAGIVRGVTDDGSLAIVTDSGEALFRAGSLVLAGDTP